MDSVFPRTTLNGTYVLTVTLANDGDTAAEVPGFVRAEGGERTKRMREAQEGNGDDEDGVTFPATLIPGANGTIQLRTGATGGLPSRRTV